MATILFHNDCNPMQITLFHIYTSMYANKAIVSIVFESWLIPNKTNKSSPFDFPVPEQNLNQTTNIFQRGRGVGNLLLSLLLKGVSSHGVYTKWSPSVRLYWHSIAMLTHWRLGTIWPRRTWSASVQVMAWCLMTPSHDLNQCWLIISGILWNSHRTNFTASTQDTSFIKWEWIIY